MLNVWHTYRQTLVRYKYRFHLYSIAELVLWNKDSPLIRKSMQCKIIFAQPDMKCWIFIWQMLSIVLWCSLVWLSARSGGQEDQRRTAAVPCLPQAARGLGYRVSQRAREVYLLLLPPAGLDLSLDFVSVLVFVSFLVWPWTWYIFGLGPGFGLAWVLVLVPIVMTDILSLCSAWVWYGVQLAWWLRLGLKMSLKLIDEVGPVHVEVKDLRTGEKREVLL